MTDDRTNWTTSQWQAELNMERAERRGVASAYQEHIADLRAQVKAKDAQIRLLFSQQRDRVTCPECGWNEPD